MKAYIINLIDSRERRKVVENELATTRDNVELVFVEAFDGRNLKIEDTYKIFNQNAAYANYGRYLIGGEVGCTASHRRCQEAFLESDEQCALIFEDDLVLNKKNLNLVLAQLEEYVSSNDAPVIVLLSGDYWYTSVSKISANVSLAKVREAVCSHAYIINRKAAEILVASDMCFLADDWYYMKNLGIKMYAVYPHIADQNRKDYKTEISDKYDGVHRENMSMAGKTSSYFRAVVKRVLKLTGHFEYKTFVE